MRFKILIVDDDTVLCEVVKLMFSSEGFDVDTAINGKIAFEKFLKSKYDCVLTDIVMPIENGITLTKNIFNSPNPVPVAIMSGYTSNIDFKEILKSPYLIGVFSKPFDEYQLINLIKEFVKKSA